jgi:ADP-ribose pyrophosphatase YjhB (NUDIX family)
LKLIYKYKNFIKLYKYDVILEKKKIKNFHKIFLNDAVMIICKFKDTILLIKEYRLALKNFSWGLPGGFIEKNERPITTAKRELLEETGIKIKKEKVKLILKFIRNGNYHCGKEYVYLCKFSEKPKIFLSTKHKWLNKKNLKLWIKNNRFNTPGVIASVQSILI